MKEHLGLYFERACRVTDCVMTKEAELRALNTVKQASSARASNNFLKLMNCLAVRKR